MSEERLPRLVIIGRPNVGKSTLFNRLFGRRRALVHDEPGVTRDRLEERALWWVDKKEFPILLVDTGGLGGDRFADEIEKQVSIALGEADVVLMLFDAQHGYTDADKAVVRKIKQSGLDKRLPVLGVVNKVDHENHEVLFTEFFASGIDPILTVSAEHGRGIDDLQAAVAAALQPRAHEFGPAAADDSDTDSDLDTDTDTDSVEDADTDSDTSIRERRIPRIAIVGRPNAGKSTLINALLDEDRMITSPIAGTTVDSVDSPAMLDGKPFVIIDTAGIRRKSKTEQGVEVLSVVQARKALERCEVAVLLLDGETGITDQDEKIGGLIEEVGCGVILALNKWDTQRKNPKFTEEIAAELVRKKMAYLAYAPILFMSALEGRGFEGLGDLADEIVKQRRVKIPTRELTEWAKDEAGIHNPMNAKFYMSHQSGRNPPTFVFHVNDPDKVHFSLRRHFSNEIRDRWGYMGSPIRLVFLKGSSGKAPNIRKLRSSSAAKKAQRARVG